MSGMQGGQPGPKMPTWVGHAVLAVLVGVALSGCVVEPIRPVVVEPPVHRPPRPAPPAPPPPVRHEPPPVVDEGPQRLRGVQVPPDRVPRAGACAIWFADLPPDRQPPAMTCAKAHEDARRWGGWVIWARGPESFRNGHVHAQDYGPHHLHGVPPDRLPRPGWCRRWFENRPPDRQPAAAPCHAVMKRQHRGSRVLYMPGTDLRR